MTKHSIGIVRLRTNNTLSRSAKIQEEDGAYTVSIRLYNRREQREAAWGQETAPSIEIASMMIGSVAERFSISKNFISIVIGMENIRDGTLH